jgi:hypothetical protein
LKFRLHQFEDGGFVARILVTRPDACYRVAVWTSDLTAFTADDNPTETSADAWFAKVLRGVRDTGAAAYVEVTHPDGFNRYFLPPAGNNETKNTDTK